MCFVGAIKRSDHLLQIGEIEELAELLLQLGLGHRLVAEQLRSVLLHLEGERRGRGSGMQ